MTVHLIEGNFDKNFPTAADEFPTPIDDVNFIDAWLFNTAFNSLIEIEEYLITYKANIEAAFGDNVMGDNADLSIPIPAALYPAGKITLANDTNLVAANIASGVSIFGVVGSLSGGGGLPAVNAPSFMVIPFIIPPDVSPATAIPSVALLRISI